MSNDNIYVFFIGSITGFVKYAGSVQTELLVRMAEAGATALVCGFLGMAGKELLQGTISYFKRKKNKDGNS